MIEQGSETWAWTARLQGDHAQQQAALDELRRVLVGNLRRALAGYRPVTDAFVEDVVQETLVRVLERLHQFEGRSRFETWATAIGIHIALSELRRQRWKDVSLSELLTDDAESALRRSASSENGVATPIRNEIVGEMYKIIHRQLTDKQRTALLAELKGMPLATIAEHLDSNRNAVYKLTHDARKRLQRGLEAAGFEAADVHAAFASEETTWP